MPRRNSAVKRDVLPDPIYNNKVVTKLINQVMMSGKKGLAQRIVYGAFDIIKEKTSLEPLDVCLTAIENVKPMAERPIKCQWKSAQNADKLLQSVGLLSMQEREQASAIWTKNLQQNLLMLTTTQAHQSRSVTKCTEWQKQTRLLHTISGKTALLRDEHSIKCLIVKIRFSKIRSLLTSL